MGAVDRLNRDKIALEQSMEAEEENIVNRLQVRWPRGLYGLAALRRRTGRLGGKAQTAATQLESLPDTRTHARARTTPPQRQLEAVLGSYRALEGRLEARGLSLRDVGVQPHEMPPE